MISIIVAVGNNNVIGKNNTLIWRLPADMKYFKDMTVDHCVITGRKNYESIPEKFRPLQNRTNIVVTRQEDYHAPGAIVVNSIEKGIEKAKELNIDDEIFIIGGAQIYEQSINIADRIYITEIHHSFDGDAFFPKIDMNNWLEVSRTKGIKDDKNNYEYDFVILNKK